MHFGYGAIVVTTIVFGSLVQTDDRAASIAARQFAALKALEGDWVRLDKDGKPTGKVQASFRITAGGHTVLETENPGEEMEMLTMYHLDGDELVMTHDCMLGNQPHLKAEKGRDPRVLVFKFAGASNLKRQADAHVHECSMDLTRSDPIKAHHIAWKDDKPNHEENVVLVRKAK